MSAKKYSLQIPRILVSLIFSLLWASSAALIVWDSTQSVIGMLFALLIGAIMGWQLAAPAIDLKGEVTIWMILGTIVGALSALIFARLMNENVKTVLLIVPLSLGALLGLYVGVETHEAIPRAIKGAIAGIVVGVFAGIIFLLTGILETFQTGDGTIVVKTIRQIVVSIFFFPLLLSIIFVTLLAMVSVSLDIWAKKFLNSDENEENQSS